MNWDGLNSFWHDSHRILFSKDCRSMADLPGESVQCVVTSPPYWGLRKYAGLPDLVWGDNHCEHKWNIESGKIDFAIQGKQSETFHGGLGYTRPAEHWQRGFCSLCGAWKGQLGLEPTPELYISHLIGIFREVRRVLRKDGVVFLNIGDSYASQGGAVKSSIYDIMGGSKPQGYEKSRRVNYQAIKPKDLCLIPFRLAIALQEDGWWVRSVIIWDKPNPMPESIRSSHFIRHYVTIEEYERLQSMRSAQSSNQDGSSDLSRMSPSQISDCQETLPAKPEGSSDSQGKRRKTRGQREAEALFSIPTRTEEQTEISGNAEGQGNNGTPFSKLQSSPIESKGYNYGRGLVGGAEQPQAPMSLLREEASEADNRPYNPIEQKWDSHEGKHSSSMSKLQFQEGQQDSDALVECPGCPKCKDGYILVKGSWRPTESHEYVLMLTKSEDYYTDQEAVRESHTNLFTLDCIRKASQRPITNPFSKEERYIENQHGVSRGELGALINPAGRNLRSVWTFPTQPYPEAHFATYPEKLVEICIKAATPEVGCCSKCGKPWVRITENKPMVIRRTNRGELAGNRTASSGTMLEPNETKTLGWKPQCKCDADKVPSIVLDPFAGSGTTLKVAAELNRRAIGYELSEDYCRLVVERNKQGVMV